MAGRMKKFKVMNDESPFSQLLINSPYTLSILQMTVEYDDIPSQAFISRVRQCYRELEQLVGGNAKGEFEWKETEGEGSKSKTL